MSLISALSGLVGVLLGGWIALRSERERRKKEFALRQLSEFYGPLLCLRQEIRARSELRARISNAADALWKEKFEGVRNPVVSQRILDDSSAKYSAIIADDNRSLRETLMPKYREMVDIFRERMWLAEPDTRSYFSSLIEFVDIWDRFLRDALPGEVIQAVGHSEENVHPFYDHLEEMCDRLRTRVEA